MNTVSISSASIRHRSDRAERIGSALAGITAVLIDDDKRHDGSYSDPPLSPVTRGNLYEALLALSDSLEDLAGYIDQLGSRQRESEA